MLNLTRRWQCRKRSANTNNKQRKTVNMPLWTTFKGNMNMPECNCDNDLLAQIQPSSNHSMGRTTPPISSVIRYHWCKMKKGSDYLYRLFTRASDTWGRCFWCHVTLGNVGVWGGDWIHSQFYPRHDSVLYYGRLHGVNGTQRPPYCRYDWQYTPTKQLRRQIINDNTMWSNLGGVNTKQSAFISTYVSFMRRSYEACYCFMANATKCEMGKDLLESTRKWKLRGDANMLITPWCRNLAWRFYEWNPYTERPSVTAEGIPLSAAYRYTKTIANEPCFPI